MTSFTHRSIRVFVARHSRLRIQTGLWTELIAELGRRAGGVRESGAFLLVDSADDKRVRRIVYFDDVDPECLTGGISMRSEAFSKLWTICRSESRRVAADVHTHPGLYIDQSAIDRANPMIATKGHVAIIVPDLASHPVTPGECGVHVYKGSHEWDSHVRADAARLLYVGPWA